MIVEINDRLGGVLYTNDHNFDKCVLKRVVTHCHTPSQISMRVANAPYFGKSRSLPPLQIWS